MLALLATAALAGLASLASADDSPPASRQGAANRPLRPDALKAQQDAVTAAYKAEDYFAASAHAQQYFRDGGTDPKVRALLGRALFQLKDFENAARVLHQEFDIAEKTPQAPAEDGLRLLGQCYAELKDVAGQTWALEKLVTYYPRKENWVELISRTQRRSNFRDDLALDVWRLRLATGAIDGAHEYMQAANLALQAGFPAEAKAFLDRGFASGMLGTGADGDRQRRRREEVAREAFEERRRLAQGDPPMSVAASPHGSALVNAGYAWITFGELDKGFALMRRGLAQPGSDRPQFDKMHLGIAYLRAGRKVEALSMFKNTTGVHGAADLGRLWYIHALQSSLN